MQLQQSTFLESTDEKKHSVSLAAEVCPAGTLSHPLLQATSSSYIY